MHCLSQTALKIKKRKKKEIFCNYRFFLLFFLSIYFKTIQSYFFHLLKNFMPILLRESREKKKKKDVCWWLNGEYLFYSQQKWNQDTTFWVRRTAFSNLGFSCLNNFHQGSNGCHLLASDSVCCLSMQKHPTYKPSEKVIEYFMVICVLRLVKLMALVMDTDCVPVGLMENQDVQQICEWKQMKWNYQCYEFIATESIVAFDIPNELRFKSLTFLFEQS